MKKLLLAVIIGVMAVGCAGSGVDENKTVAQIVEQVKTMDVAQIEAKINQYTQAIEAKGVELDAVKEKLAAIPMTQLMGEEAKTIKKEVDAITSSIKALKEKLNVYTKALKEKSMES